MGQLVKFAKGILHRSDARDLSAVEVKITRLTYLVCTSLKPVNTDRGYRAILHLNALRKNNAQAFIRKEKSGPLLGKPLVDSQLVV